MVDTCGTLKKAVDYLKDEGALNVMYIAAHPVLSGKAFQNLSDSRLSKLIISDTIDVPSIPSYVKNLITQVSCMPVLEHVIMNLINDESISKINSL